MSRPLKQTPSFTDLNGNSRTRQRITELGIDSRNLLLAGSHALASSWRFKRAARRLLRTSVGIQEETTYLGVPRLTLKAERPITLTLRPNILVDDDRERLVAKLGRVMEGKQKNAVTPLSWDGHAGDLIADIL
jgi:UDP-N-acetylglucosamine 2-epimerase (non-hydrolysing)